MGPAARITANGRRVLLAGFLATVGAGLLSAAGGCGNIWLNLSKERTGDISLIFINTTPYRAAFTYGTYDAWDRGPGSIDFQQLALDGNATSATITLTCARNTAVATADMVQRVLDTDGDKDNDAFVPEQFDSIVHFSDAPAGSDAQYLPTKGSARGLDVRLGVDFSCADTLLFTFVEDPDAEGGFRIDFEVILDELADE